MTPMGVPGTLPAVRAPARRAMSVQRSSSVTSSPSERSSVSSMRARSNWPGVDGVVVDPGSDVV